MKKKLFALLIGTILLGTILSGCKSSSTETGTNAVSENTVSEKKNSEEDNEEETYSSGLTEDEILDWRDERIQVDRDETFPPADTNFLLCTYENGDQEALRFVGSNEMGYTFYQDTYPLTSGYHWEIEAFEKGDCSYKEFCNRMADYERIQKKIYDKNDSVTFTETEKDGYIEHIVVNTEAGASGETYITRYYDYEDVVQTVGILYSNDEEDAVEREAFENALFFHNDEELEDYIKTIENSGKYSSIERK